MSLYVKQRHPGLNILRLHVKAVQICLVSVQVWEILKIAANIWKFDQSNIFFQVCFHFEKVLKIESRLN